MVHWLSYKGFYHRHVGHGSSTNTEWKYYRLLQTWSCGNLSQSEDNTALTEIYIQTVSWQIRPGAGTLLSCYHYSNTVCAFTVTSGVASGWPVQWPAGMHVCNEADLISSDSNIAWHWHCAPYEGENLSWDCDPGSFTYTMCVFPYVCVSVWGLCYVAGSLKVETNVLKVQKKNTWRHIKSS